MSQVLRCSDLEALGMEGVLDHDPRHQGPDDPHCGGWRDDPARVREHGEVFSREPYDSQRCNAVEIRELPDGRRLVVCCVCLDAAGGVDRIAERLAVLELEAMQEEGLVAAGGAR